MQQCKETSCKSLVSLSLCSNCLDGKENRPALRHFIQLMADEISPCSDCFLLASASLLFSCILRCVGTVCIVQTVREEYGVTWFGASLSPPKQITKSCVLSTDPCYNTACAAFEKYVNLLSSGAVHSCTIHASDSSSVGAHIVS